MQCPKCQTTMREREKENVIIDICPSCRGVWLDAGELEKLSETEHRYYRNYRWDDDDDDDFYRRSPDARYRDDPRYRGRYPKKKKGFLSNIFENFGGEGADD